VRRRIDGVVVSLGGKRGAFVAIAGGLLLLLLSMGGARAGVERKRGSRRDILMAALGGRDSGIAPVGGPMLAAWRQRWFGNQLWIVVWLAKRNRMDGAEARVGGKLGAFCRKDPAASRQAQPHCRRGPCQLGAATWQWTSDVNPTTAVPLRLPSQQLSRRQPPGRRPYSPT
jgi:hypothetical protein